MTKVTTSVGSVSQSTTFSKTTSNERVHATPLTTWLAAESANILCDVRPDAAEDRQDSIALKMIANRDYSVRFT